MYHHLHCSIVSAEWQVRTIFGPLTCVTFLPKGVVSPGLLVCYFVQLPYFSSLSRSLLQPNVMVAMDVLYTQSTVLTPNAPLATIATTAHNMRWLLPVCPWKDSKQTTPYNSIKFTITPTLREYPGAKLHSRVFNWLYVLNKHCNVRCNSSWVIAPCAKPFICLEVKVLLLHVAYWLKMIPLNFLWDQYSVSLLLRTTYNIMLYISDVLLLAWLIGCLVTLACSLPTCAMTMNKLNLIWCSLISWLCYGFTLHLKL